MKRKLRRARPKGTPVPRDRYPGAGPKAQEAARQTRRLKKLRVTLPAIGPKSESRHD